MGDEQREVDTDSLVPLDSLNRRVRCRGEVEHSTRIQGCLAASIDLYVVARGAHHLAAIFDVAEMRDHTCHRSISVSGLVRTIKESVADHPMRNPLLFLPSC